MKLILESWRQYLKEEKEKKKEQEKIDVIDNTLYAVDIGDGAGSRYFAIVRTEDDGIVPFYQSSGKSTKDKAQGHWHIFLGFKPYKGTDRVGITLLKTQETIDLINNEPDGELAKIAKALPTHEFTKLEKAENSPERNNFVQQPGDEISYSEALVQSAIGNKWLYDAGALDPGTMARDIDPETDFIGFEKIPIGKLDVRIADKYKHKPLPARYNLAGSTPPEEDQ